MDRPFELEEKRPQVAVVGAGYWGINHVRNFYELGALSVVCDTSNDSLLRIKEKTPAVRIETDFECVLLDDSIRGVVIATPAETHYRM
ncbi:MAG TPA: Gfo/Idh/MocA family oxidoreductase, partial [Blastocatellia bacterium]|nr:Gfo/Idh/MocA family oxidoreductase [Blastocatellia bacterium]